MQHLVEGRHNDVGVKGDNEPELGVLEVTANEAQVRAVARSCGQDLAPRSGSLSAPRMGAVRLSVCS